MITELINSIGDFMLQLAQILPNNPMLGLIILGSMPVLFILGALKHNK